MAIEKNELVPSYLEVDYNTFINKIISQLQENETFADYNYEGSNIRLLIELNAYMAALNTFYNNRIAKNVFLDTADQYQTISMLSKQGGYEPYGYRAGKCNLDLIIRQPATSGYSLSLGPSGESDYNVGETLQILNNKVFQVNTELLAEYSRHHESTNVPEAIKFVNLESYEHTVLAPSAYESPYGYSIIEDEITGEELWRLRIPGPELYQGELVTFNYTGLDIVDNKIVLPFYKFAHNDDDNVITVTVNGEVWTKITDNLDEISGLSETDDNVYLFKYTKYNYYVVEFSYTRNVPNPSDIIQITLLKTLGTEGKIGKNLIKVTPGENYIRNLNKLNQLGSYYYIENSQIEVLNTNVLIGADDPETIDTIRDNAKGMLHSQYRTVNELDYSSFLASHSDVVKGRIYGEKDIHPLGDRANYNYIHVVVFPEEWNTNIDGATLITTSASTWTIDDITPNITGTIYSAVEWSNNFKEEIKRYLEPRKMLVTRELFDVPDLVYFMFYIEVELKQLYDLINVKNDLLDKLEYYFKPENRIFGDTINFNDISNFLINTSIVKEDHLFENIKGIRSLTFRRIYCSKNVYYEYDEYDADQYPRYDKEINIKPTDATRPIIEAQNINILKQIKLGFNQFPMLAKNMCIVRDN